MAHSRLASWQQVSVGTGLLDLACIFSEDKGLRVDCRDRVGSPGRVVLTTAR